MIGRSLKLLDEIRSRHAQLLDLRASSKPESDWIIQEFGARTALERLCTIAADLGPEVPKRFEVRLPICAETTGLKESLLNCARTSRISGPSHPGCPEFHGLAAAAAVFQVCAMARVKPRAK